MKLLSLVGDPIKIGGSLVTAALALLLLPGGHSMLPLKDSLADSYGEVMFESLEESYILARNSTSEEISLEIEDYSISAVNHLSSGRAIPVDDLSFFPPESQGIIRVAQSPRHLDGRLIRVRDGAFFEARSLVVTTQRENLDRFLLVLVLAGLSSMLSLYCGLYIVERDEARPDIAKGS